jgi:Sortase domain
VRRSILMVTAALSAAVIVVIVLFLATRDSVPRVSREGALTVAPPSTLARATVPTQPAVSAPTPTPIPTAMSVPAIGVSATIQPVGVEPGTNAIEVPPLDRVGWYEYAARPGAAGSSVLLGHVDGSGREGVFFRLGSLGPGSPVQVRFADGSLRGFHVIGRAEYQKSALPAEYFSKAGPSRLVLITCGGAFDASTRHYRDNVVIVAVPDA